MYQFWFSSTGSPFTNTFPWVKFQRKKYRNWHVNFMQLTVTLSVLRRPVKISSKVVFPLPVYDNSHNIKHVQHYKDLLYLKLPWLHSVLQDWNRLILHWECSSSWYPGLSAVESVKLLLLPTHIQCHLQVCWIWTGHQLRLHTKYITIMSKIQNWS